jgi:lauroyl/myristoyl acyltransferase
VSSWGRPPFELARRLLKFPKELGLRLEFAAVWLAIVIARAIPLEVASWLSGNLWRLIAPRLRRQKRALANLELAFPEKSLGERKAIAAAMWENLGRTFAESFRIKTLTASDRIVFEPAEGFDEAARGAKPCRPGGRFSIRIMPISIPQTNNSAADALVATQALQRQYEAFIREAPEQWMWAHRKWG